MKPLKRTQVYEILDEEREYQDKKWGGKEHDEAHSVSDWLIFIRKHLNQAENAIYNSDAKSAMDAVRKITGIGVAAMEAKGSPRRKK